MSVTYTAGYNNIWTHFDRNPEEDLSGGYLVTSVTPISGGVTAGVAIPGVPIALTLNVIGPSVNADQTLVGKTLSQIEPTLSTWLVTEQSLSFAGVINETVTSDTPILQPNFNPNSTDPGGIEGIKTFFAGDDTFYGVSVGVVSPIDGSISVEDDINGWGGNDHFWGRLGDDNYVGGTGTDTAHYEGSLSQFTIAQVEGVWNDSVGEGFPGWQITDGSGSEGTDRMTGVERAVFSDATIALDLDGVGGQAYRIYKAAFDRVPDSGGLGYWINQMDDGMDMVEVAARFIDSDEFRALYGTNPTNGEFLTKVYNNVLDRDPDAGGYDWWMDQLTNNPEKTWQKVLADFSESPENQTNVAELIANGIQFEPWVG